MNQLCIRPRCNKEASSCIRQRINIHETTTTTTQKKSRKDTKEINEILAKNK